MTGSKICQKRLKAIMKACVNCEADAGDCFDPVKNPKLKQAIREAKRDLVPQNYVLRVIQFARQGYTDIDFSTYDTDWDSEAYLTVSGQNSNNSIRIPNSFFEALDKDGDWTLTNRVNKKAAKTVGCFEALTQGLKDRKELGLLQRDGNSKAPRRYQDVSAPLRKPKGLANDLAGRSVSPG